MASKTAARSGARTSRSKASSAADRRPARPAAPPQAGHAAQTSRWSPPRAPRSAGRPRRLADGGQGRRHHRPLGRPRPRHRTRPPPRRHRAGAARRRGRRRRQFVVRRGATRRRLDRHRRCARSSARRWCWCRSLLGVDRRVADAHRTQSRRPAAADPGRGDDRSARARPVAPVVRRAAGSRRPPARRRLRRLRHRRAAVGRADARGSPPRC